MAGSSWLAFRTKPVVRLCTKTSSSRPSRTEVKAISWMFVHATAKVVVAVSSAATVTLRGLFPSTWQLFATSVSSTW